MAEPGPKARVGPCRNLHFVFKVADRTATSEFYRGLLCMEPLRHEEFTEGCDAACNGPYDGHWSKTMIGYGDEDHNFVLELTYNYGVKSYQLGNDYSHTTIASKRVFANAAAKGAGTLRPASPSGQAASREVAAPDGYRFVVVDEDAPGPCPITEVCLHVQDIGRSTAYWGGFLGMAVQQPSAHEALVCCAPGQCALRLVQLPQGQKLDRGTAFGRIAFACPGEQLQQLQADVRSAGYAVHTPYVSLDTPGKRTVQVVILQDPDGHEICFVGDEGFRDLSRVDPAAAALLDEAIKADGSAAWFQKRQEQEKAWAAQGL